MVVWLGAVWGGHLFCQAAGKHIYEKLAVEFPTAIVRAMTDYLPLNIPGPEDPDSTIEWYETYSMAVAFLSRYI